MFNLPKGPFCQSCGMPIDSDDLSGTNQDGSKSSEFCTYCFQGGQYTAPELTMNEMIKKATEILIDRKKMPAIQAAMITNTFIPKLKRWQQ